MTDVPLLLLDVDGTVREGIDDPLGKFVNGPDDVRVFPQARALMANWREAGGRIAAVTNQGGMALGYFDIPTLSATIRETDRQLSEQNAQFDRWSICPHHPDGMDWPDCWCRKPLPGLVHLSIIDLRKMYPDEEYPRSRALMVGDLDTDRQCADAAGVKFMWAEDWRAGV